jgi:hypothetical protein
LIDVCAAAQLRFGYQARPYNRSMLAATVTGIITLCHVLGDDARSCTAVQTAMNRHNYNEYVGG